jgi:preprotein translocase subunit SecD
MASVVAAACAPTKHVAATQPDNSAPVSSSDAVPGYDLPNDFPSAPKTFELRPVLRTDLPQLGLDAAPETPANSTPAAAASISAAAAAAYAALDCADGSTATPQNVVPSHDEQAVCASPLGLAAAYRTVLGAPILNGSDVASATIEAPDVPGAPGNDVVVTVTPSGSAAFASYTGSHVGATVAIVVDGRVVAFETIEGQITTPTVLLAAEFSSAAARRIANDIESAAHS